jgi:glycosyltransferase involved in cell wall biosynthesis
MVGIAAVGRKPMVSIVIDNFNYARYLSDAIDSALGQTYDTKEVIVVDDGSTDESRQIISSYGARLIPVLKENGGQLSALNAGFAASRGDVVCLLDADDVFLPKKVSVIVKTWQENRQASVIYHQLQGIDSEGNKLWKGKPWPQPFCQGDIREKVERSGGWWLWPNTSGLCFPRSFLERVLPGPAEGFRYCADTYLASIAPFLGPVVGIPWPLTSYRLHGRNWVMQFAQAHRSEEGRSMARSYADWFDIIGTTLRERCGVQTNLAFDNHYIYQIHRRNAGAQVSMLHVLSTIVRCPLLPPKMKAKETINVLRHCR